MHYINRFNVKTRKASAQRPLNSALPSQIEDEYCIDILLAVFGSDTVWAWRSRVWKIVLQGSRLWIWSGSS